MCSVIGTWITISGSSGFDATSRDITVAEKKTAAKKLTRATKGVAPGKVAPPNKDPAAKKERAPKKETGAILTLDGREVRISNPDKPYFSRDVKLSKLDVVQYYLSVAGGADR